MSKTSGNTSDNARERRPRSRALDARSIRRSPILHLDRRENSGFTVRTQNGTVFALSNQRQVTMVDSSRRIKDWMIHYAGRTNGPNRHV